MNKTYLRSSVALLATFLAGASVSHAFAASPEGTDQFFVVQEVTPAPGGAVRFSGQFIVDGSVDVIASSSSDDDDDDTPHVDLQIGPLEPFEVKWILGPNGEGRGFAESMGYETVEHDDFSYPSGL